MHIRHVPIFLAAAVVSFSFAACGGDDDAPQCVDCGPYGGGAVLCYIGLRPSPDVICAPDQNLAATQCTEGGGSYVPVALCPLSDETGGEAEEGPGSAPWDPGRSINFDPSAGEFVIDEAAFEDLKLDPAPVFFDSSALRQHESGYYQVAVEGELSNALGWQSRDLLLAVDGHPLGSLADFATAYTNLANNHKFALTVQRGREKIVLRYRVE